MRILKRINVYGIIPVSIYQDERETYPAGTPSILPTKMHAIPLPMTQGFTTSYPANM
jgi:hypothetical protein